MALNQRDRALSGHSTKALWVKLTKHGLKDQTFLYLYESIQGSKPADYIQECVLEDVSVRRRDSSLQ